MKAFEDTIKDIQENYSFHINQAEKYKRLLDFAVDSMSEAIETLNKEDQPYIKPSKMNIVGEIIKPYKQKTFGDTIYDILNEKGRPMNASELSSEYFNRTHQTIDRKQFSARLSIIAKNKKKIKNKEYKEFPNDYRFWWGLIEWYDLENNDYNNQFKEKIMVEVERLRAA